MKMDPEIPSDDKDDPTNVTPEQMAEAEAIARESGDELLGLFVAALKHLQAENIETQTFWKADIARFEGQITKLQAENERLDIENTSLAHKVGPLVAENERLQKEKDEWRHVAEKLGLFHLDNGLEL